MINNPKDFFQQIQNLCEELGLKMKAISESIAGFISKSDAESMYLKKTDAQSTYLGKTAKAESAKTADTATSATSATKATQDGNGAVISSTYLKSATASSTYLTKSDAQATYLGKDAKAQSATFADTATTATSANSALKATQDGDGNVISGTYLKNANAESTYLTKTDASSTYLGKTAKAASASTADSATKATQDGNGANIASTYVKTVNNVAPVNGNVEIEVSSSGVAATGNRGQLAGYEDSYVVDPADDAEGSILFVNENSPDTQRVQGDGNITISVQSGSTGTSWTKTLLISSGHLGTFTRLQLGNGWTWEGGEIPALEHDAEYLLVLHWCNDVGIASLVVGGAVRKAGKGVLSITNDSNTYVWVYQDSADAKSLVYQFFSPGENEIQLAVGDQLNSPINVTVVNSSGISFDTTSATWITVTDIEPEFSLTVQAID